MDEDPYIPAWPGAMAMDRAKMVLAGEYLGDLSEGEAKDVADMLEVMKEIADSPLGRIASSYLRKRDYVSPDVFPVVGEIEIDGKMVKVRKEPMRFYRWNKSEGKP